MTDTVTQTRDVEGYLALAERLIAAERRADQIGPDEVREFYRDNLLGPQAPTDGPVRSLHIPLSATGGPDGPARQLDTTGFDTQPMLVDAVIVGAATRPRTVIELGCGEGFNTLYLARRHPDITFIGYDLLPEHVATANRSAATTPNASFETGDYQALPLATATADLMFTVESVCHATDRPALFAEVTRGLRPGGSILLIEQLRADGFAEVDAHTRHMCEVVEALLHYPPPLPSAAQWADVAAAVGMAHRDTRDLTPAALPRLRLMARVGERALLRPDPPADVDLRFILTGLLTYEAMARGGHGMYAVHIDKPES